jgi:multiple sugar transport system substrate-binding protein
MRRLHAGETANTIGLIPDVALWKQFNEMIGADNVDVFPMPAPGGAVAKLPASGGIGCAVKKKSPNADLTVEFAKKPSPCPRFCRCSLLMRGGAVTANAKLDTSSVTSPDSKVIFG